MIDQLLLKYFSYSNYSAGMISRPLRVPIALQASPFMLDVKPLVEPSIIRPLQTPPVW